MNALAWRLVFAAFVAASALSGPGLAGPGAATGWPPAGQEPGNGQQPSFRSTTELVVVDVSALGEDGTPVKDLKVEDFTVTIDGNPRRIGSLKFVDQSAAEPPASPARPGARYSSNESGSAGRLILILVDEGSIRFGGLRAAAESIERLLAGFGPADRIALVTLPNARTLVDFTSDRARVAAAIKTIPGGAGAERSFGEYYVRVSEAFRIDQGDSTLLQAVIDRECPASGVEREFCITTIGMDVTRIVASERNRTTEFISNLRTFFIALRTIDAPKLVVVFSEGFASPEAPLAMTALGRDAADARAVIYAMRLDRSMFDISIKRPGAPDGRVRRSARGDHRPGCARRLRPRPCIRDHRLGREPIQAPRDRGVRLLPARRRARGERPRWQAAPGPGRCETTGRHAAVPPRLRLPCRGHRREEGLRGHHGVAARRDRSAASRRHLQPGRRRSAEGAGAGRGGDRPRRSAGRFGDRRVHRHRREGEIPADHRPADDALPRAVRGVAVQPGSSRCRPEPTR